MADEIKEESKKITLRLVESGNETVFQVKRSTPILKIKKAYADKYGKDVGSIRLMVDGEVMDNEKNCEDFDLDDDCQIDVTLQQLGGSSF